MEKRPRFDWRLIAVVLAIPVVVIAVTGIRGLMGGSPTATPSPTPAQPAPTQLPTVHTPLPVTVVPTPGVTLASPIPSAREMTAMAYDAPRDDIVMFGGGGFGPGVAPPPANDTWTFDSTGWHEQHPRPSPPGLSDLLMTEDPSTRDLVLVGAKSTSLSAKVSTRIVVPRTLSGPSPSLSRLAEHDVDEGCRRGSTRRRGGRWRALGWKPRAAWAARSLSGSWRSGTASTLRSEASVRARLHVGRSSSRSNPPFSSTRSEATFLGVASIRTKPGAFVCSMPRVRRSRPIPFRCRASTTW